MKITITGSLYSGKSCTAKEISKELNIKYYSVGEIQRKLAEDNDMSIKDYNKFMDDNNLDCVVDERTKEVGEKENDFIFDGRLAWYFIPDSFKIYLYVSIDEAVNRAMNEDRGKAEHYDNIEEAKRSIEERRSLEIHRFKKLYNIDLADKGNYDIVIDTSQLTLEEVTYEVKSAIFNKFKNI